MDWVEAFYSTTDRWWGGPESAVRPHDRQRATYVGVVAPSAHDVLELGCGYGATAAAIAATGAAVLGIDVSDRIERAPSPAAGVELGFLRADFYEVDIGQTFDVVCYWDGFGVGTDADQQRLLRRIADEWLRPGGVAIVEAYNPAAWAADDGLTETISATPERGYQHSLGHRRSFDAAATIAHDTWWEVGSEVEHTQSLRCYSPTEFTALASEVGLAVDQVTSLEDPDNITSLKLTEDDWSYIAVLRHG